MKRASTVIWLGIFLFLYFFLYYIDLFLTSPRTIFLLIGALILLVVFRKKMRMEKMFIPILLFGMYLLILELSLNEMTLLEITLHLLRSIGIPIATVYLISSLVDNEKKYFDTVAILMVLGVIIAVFVIGQFLNIPFFWDTRAAIGDLETVNDLTDPIRPPGLAVDVIDVSYQLALLAPISFIFLSRRKKIYLWLIPLLIVAGAMLTLRRSCVFSVVVALAIFLLSKYAKINKFVVYTVGIIIILFIPMLFIQNEAINIGRLSSLDDPSARARIGLFTTAINSIEQYPLGVGYAGYKEVWSTQFSPHNQFLEIGAYYGLIGLILLMWFTFSLFKFALSEIKKSSGKVQTINFLILLALLSYTLNSFFHHSGFFLGNGEAFILIGLLIASKNIRGKKSESENISSHVSS